MPQLPKAIIPSKVRLTSTHAGVQRPLMDHKTPDSSDGTSGLADTNSVLLQQHQTHSPRHRPGFNSPTRGNSHAGNTMPPAADAATAADVTVGVLSEGPKQRLSWRHVLSEAWQSILALFLVYCVTLSLFPGVLAEDLKVGPVACTGLRQGVRVVQISVLDCMFVLCPV